jgi:hypothetical protein
VARKGETLPSVIQLHEVRSRWAIAAASMVSIALALAVVILLEWIVGPEPT